MGEGRCVMADGGRSKNEPMPPGGNVSPSKWETQQKAVALRSAGHTYREIGRALTIDHTWARQLCIQWLGEVKHEGVEALRDQEGARLDKMMQAVWRQALNGDLPAVHTVLRIMERRSRLFGLDAPVRIEVSDHIDRQLQELAASMPPVVVEGEVMDDASDPA